MLLKSFKSLVFDAAIWDVFPLFQRPADLKNIVCLHIARCDTRPRLPVSRILTLEDLGRSFKSNMASTMQCLLEQSKQPHKTATQKKISLRKADK